MESIRVTAKTVEDALTEASIELGTSSDNIEYTVIDKGSSGFFGIGGRKAVIEAKKKFTDEDLKKEIFGEQEETKKKEIRPEKKVYKKEFRKDTGKEEKKQVNQPESRKDTNEKEQDGGLRREYGKERAEEKTGKNTGSFRKESKKNSYNQPGKPDTVREERRDFRKNKVQTENAEITGSSVKEEKKDMPGKEAPRALPDQEKKVPAFDEAAAVSAEKKEEIRPRTPANPEEAKQRAEQFLKNVLETMGMPAEFHMEFEDDTLSVDITGEEMGVLIGKRGQTLDSLQYLTSLVVNKGEASYVRVKLDTEDYRNRRKATLENLAKNIALKVKKTRKPVFLEPMNPYERRIIHAALQNDPYVTTHSEGEEPYRKVVVTLRRDREKDLDREFDRDRNRRRSYGYPRRGSRYPDKRGYRFSGQTEEKSETETAPVNAPAEETKEPEE